MDACQTCKFFMPTEEPQGLCRRFPPVPVPTAEGVVVSQFPAMMAAGWCGEHKEKTQ